jgi:hypothetical protein
MEQRGEEYDLEVEWPTSALNKLDSAELFMQRTPVRFGTRS